MEYPVFEAPRLRLLQQKAESPEESKDAHPAAVSAQLMSARSFQDLCALPEMLLLLLRCHLYISLLLPNNWLLRPAKPRRGGGRKGGGGLPNDSTCFCTCFGTRMKRAQDQREICWESGFMKGKMISPWVSRATCFWIEKEEKHLGFLHPVTAG